MASPRRIHAAPASSRRRSKPDLIERLRSCGTEVLACAPNVNHGGCGYYAAHVAMALEERGITVWGVITSCLRDDDLNIVRNQSKPHTLRQWNDAGVVIGHILVEFEHNGRIWRHDARNTVCAKSRREPTFGKLLCPGYMTTPELVSIATARTGWNKAFNRRAGMPVIRTAVRRHLRALPRSE
jgi:hypothetical protein